ncbi:ribosome-inactivating protein bryodin II-like [Prunus yedoensis var. nudiflora]|uniref:rRNA N-glycosylase n=1 Tax=Prunus yedoensis var. nudiflora TaxID=2094558 RepID=A0A314ZJQ8_PRUYE|nr:ribosome-inactivating protein bryodin II-like [Prunus yedoensis var. nudiflora]
MESIQPFFTLNSTPETYKILIQYLRLRLTAGRPTAHGIPVLPRREDVPDERRFILIDLTNYAGDTITVAIDVVTAYVVGYAAGGRSYFLQENARENPPPIHVLFRNTIRMPTLSFDGTYHGLSAAAHDAVVQYEPRHGRGHSNPPAGANIHENTRMIDRIPLGRDELSNAISLLCSPVRDSYQAVGFIVIIQMLSEAARFRSIEFLLAPTMQEGEAPITPPPAMRSLESNWSRLSEEIQRAQHRNERRFNRTVVLCNMSNEHREVNSVDAPLVRGIAMLLYDRDGNQNQNQNQNRNQNQNQNQNQTCIPGPSVRMNERRRFDDEI